MICQRCGRELADDATMCAGCGLSQVTAERPKSLPPREYLNNLINWGKGQAKASKVMTWLIVLAVVLSSFAVSTQFVDYAFMLERAGALVSSVVGSIDFGNFFSDVQDQIDESVDDEVSGPFLVLQDQFVDRVLIEEYQKKNGDRYREERIDDKITVKFYRFTRNDDWLNTHIFSLYPNITKVDSYENSPIVSGFTSHRLSIPADDEDTIINAIIIDDMVNDYIFIVETDRTTYVEYEYIIEDWIDTLSLSNGENELSPSDE